MKSRLIKRLEFLTAALLATFLVIFFVLLLERPMALPVFIVSKWESMRTIFKTEHGRLILTIICAVVGVLFYLVRSVSGVLFGAGEIWCGILACWVGLNPKESNSIAATVALYGGIYLIVSGLEHYREDGKKLRQQKVFKYLLFDLRDFLTVYLSQARRNQLTQYEAMDLNLLENSRTLESRAESLKKELDDIEEPAVRAAGRKTQKVIENFRSCNAGELKDTIQEFQTYLVDAYGIDCPPNKNN